MFKFFRCLFLGHSWELLLNRSYPPKLATVNGRHSFETFCGLLGFTSLVQRCDKCGKIEEYTTLGGEKK